MEEELPRLREGLSRYPDWVREETAALNIEQMAFAAQEPAWARWSIELQVRHMAMVPVAWLRVRGGEVVRAAGYSFPPSAEVLASIRQGGGRHVPPEVAPGRDALLALMREWSGYACSILDREGPEGLRAVRFTRYADPQEHRAGDPRRTVEYNRLVSRIHPSGFAEEPGRPGHFTIELGAALRQIYWEMLAHLRNIQRIKKLQGLPGVVELPREGYLTMREFYD